MIDASALACTLANCGAGAIAPELLVGAAGALALGGLTFGVGAVVVVCVGVVVVPWLCCASDFGALRGRGALVGVVVVDVVLCGVVLAGVVVGAVTVEVEVVVLGVVAVVVGVVVVPVVLGVVFTGASAGVLDVWPPGLVTVGACATEAAGNSAAPALVSAAARPLVRHRHGCVWPSFILSRYPVGARESGALASRSGAPDPIHIGS